MAKKKPNNKKPSTRYNKYKVAGNKLEKARSCPRCGEGTFMAQHKDRTYCGLCHYTEFKSKQ